MLVYRVRGVEDAELERTRDMDGVDVVEVTTV